MFYYLVLGNFIVVVMGIFEGFYIMDRRLWDLVLFYVLEYFIFNIFYVVWEKSILCLI